MSTLSLHRTVSLARHKLLKRLVICRARVKLHAGAFKTQVECMKLLVEEKADLQVRCDILRKVLLYFYTVLYTNTDTYWLFSFIRI